MVWKQLSSSDDILAGRRYAVPQRIGKATCHCRAAAWRSLDDVEVVAICTSRQETAVAAAAKSGLAKAYGDFRKLALDSDIDIIDAGTRPKLRHEMATAALLGGKHAYAGMAFGLTRTLVEIRDNA